MKIYYVSKACQAKGPAFLRLAGEDYLDEGDICIVGTETNTIAYLLTNVQRTWSQCKIIAKLTLTVDADWSNFLLYAYNGFNGRKGNVRALEILQSIFKSTALVPLFEEVIEILKFKKDHIDASVIQKIYKKALEKQSETDHKLEIKNPEIIEQKKFFVSFIKPDVIDKIRHLLVPGITAKEIVALIKKSYPHEFRQAFIEYNRYDPTGSIKEGLLEYLRLDEEKIGVAISENNTITNKNYEEIFSNLNVNKQGNKISLHNPILLLAVMELVEQGEIVSPFIPISRELELTFQHIWTQYIPEDANLNCAFEYPFYQMESESFWQLVSLPWLEKKDSYSLKELRQNFYGAIIDDELYMAFCDERRRETLKEIIINTYLSLNKSSKDDCHESSNISGLTDNLDEDKFSDRVVDERVDYNKTLKKIRIVDYSLKTFAVYGDTQNLYSAFKDLGGSYRDNLKDGPGWVFHRSLHKKIVDLLIEKQKDFESSFHTNELLTSKASFSHFSPRNKIKNNLYLPYGAKIKKVTSKDFEILGNMSSSQLLHQFVKAVGVQKVYDLKIPFLRGLLVDIRPNEKYRANCKYYKEGFWLNATGSLGKKVEHILYIADKLNIKIDIEIESCE